MLLRNITFIRGMARKAKNIKEIMNQTAAKKKPLSVTKSSGKEKIVVSSKEKISSGEKEIVVIPKQKNQRVHHTSSLTTFESLNLRPDVIAGLESIQIVTPTVIQLLGIPLVLEGKNICCAAQTGSGKTVVYAAPIVNMMQEDNEKGFIGRLSRPRAIVIAPGRELASQILSVFKSFSHYAPFRSVGLIGQKQKKWTRDYIKGAVDVVVATPDTLLKYHRRGHIIFSDLQFIVFDEADTLFDENFRETMQSILQLSSFHNDGIESSKKPVQCILTVATLPPKGVLSGYKAFVPDLEICESNLHKVLPHVKHTFVKTEQNKKFVLLLSRLQNVLKRKGEKCLIFCNTSKSCNWVSWHLKNENNINHSKMHGNMNPQVRFQDYESFINGDCNLLVCSDIASRGLDTTDVSLVINFDCPFNTSDYIHRSGRTGRATEIYAGKGEVITYITQNKEVVFAKKIQSAALKNESLKDVRSKQNSLKTRHEKQMQIYREAFEVSQKRPTKMAK